MEKNEKSNKSFLEWFPKILSLLVLDCFKYRMKNKTNKCHITENLFCFDHHHCATYFNYKSNKFDGNTQIFLIN